MTQQVSTDHLEIIAAALNRIGLTATPVPEADGFLSGVRIVNGALEYQADCRPSNLLHEAGHLAVIPESLRHLANDDIDDVEAAIGAMFENGQFTDPDAPLARACLQCSDVEATAWAFAFGRHCGIPDDVIITDHADEYDGEGEDVRFGLANNAYIGINGLRAAGFLTSARDFPRLSKWLQNGI